jgi:hypothetical protein
MAKIDIANRPLREKRCENCACYDAFEKQCHASLPVVIPMGGQDGRLGAASLFPPMKPEDWCRKHEAVLS